MIEERDVQPVADMRLIALSLAKRWGPDSRYRAEVAAMLKVCVICKRMLAEGPATGHHVIEASASLEEVQADLRRSVFGSPSR